MVSKESLINDLKICAAQAAAVLYSILANDTKAEIDDSFEILEANKQPVYDDTLFIDASSLLCKLEHEPISDEEVAFIEKLVAQIDLASFAYHISQRDEFERCANAYFQRVVPSFNKYTKDEIRLFLCLHLYLLREEMNFKQNVDRTKLIKRHFPKDWYAYFLGDTSSGKEAGRRQIMMAVNMVSEFLFSRASELDEEIRFGAPAMVNTFLQKFIQYRLDEDFSSESDRQLEEGFPETKDEMKALVDEIFNDEFIDEVIDGSLASNDNTDAAAANDSNSDEYAPEDGSEQEGEDSDLESVDSDSSSDDSSSTPSTSERSSTEVSAYSMNENSEEEELEEEENVTTGSTSSREANATRHRITDEQPGARAVTAQEADFTDGTDVGSSSNSNASGSRHRQTSSSHQQNPRKRRAPVIRESEPSTSASSSANTSVNGDEEREETTIPRKVHVCDDGKPRPVAPIPKIREKAQRWTEQEVNALEEGLRIYKTTAWTDIHNTFKDVLGLHKATQLKDKSKNEVKRRQKLGIPLGGFKYFLNPGQD